MDATTIAGIPDNPKEIKAAITNMLAQIDVMREQMKADDAAIARINAEIAALKAESQALGEETRSILSNVYKILNHA